MNFPNDILSDLIEYTRENYREHLSYSHSTLEDVAGEGISYWEIFETAIVVASKENDVEMVKFCLDSLENRDDYNLELEANNYRYVKNMLEHDSHAPLLYYLENQDIDIDDNFRSFYQNYKDSVYFKKNIASQVLEVYLLNSSLEQDLSKDSLEHPPRRKI